MGLSFYSRLMKVRSALWFGSVASFFPGCPNDSFGTTIFNLALTQTAAEVSLELFTVQKKSGVNCASLSINADLLANIKPVARAKLGEGGQDGPVSLSASRLKAGESRIIFVRAMDYRQNLVLATGCNEDVVLASNQTTEVVITLTPAPSGP